MILALPSWFALFYLLTSTPPHLGNRWLFYALIVSSLTGTIMPGVAFFNRLFAVDGGVGFQVIVRESLLVGLYTAVVLWLNKGQVLTLGLGLVIALGMLLAEGLIRLRSRSKWDPEK